MTVLGHYQGEAETSATPQWEAAVQLGSAGQDAVRGGASLPRPRVCLGMPLYNETTHLPAALESLLGQTYADFRLIVSDDSTTPEPGEIVRAFAARDPRVVYHKNASRLGMVENWRAAFRRAGADVDFFAWVGDHDVWHPCWLESLLKALQEDPDAVVAYPVAAWVSGEGEFLPKRSPRFDTCDLGAAERTKAVCLRAKRFGNMVYGLFRASALCKVGVFRRVIVPDIMLLTELSLHGAFRHVSQQLWVRRYREPPAIGRQRLTLFTRPPWYAHLAWPILNSLILGWNTALRPGAGGPVRRVLGLRLALLHFWRWAPLIGEATRFGSLRANWERFRAWRGTCPRGKQSITTRLREIMRSRKTIAPLRERLARVRWLRAIYRRAKRLAGFGAQSRPAGAPRPKAAVRHPAAAMPAPQTQVATSPLDPRIRDYLARMSTLSGEYRPSLFWENLLAQFRTSSGGRPPQQIGGAELEEMFRYMGYGFEDLPRGVSCPTQDPRYLDTIALGEQITPLLKKAKGLRGSKEEWEHMYALKFLMAEGLLEEYLDFIEPLPIRSSMPVARFYYYRKVLLDYRHYLPQRPWNVMEIGAGAGNFAYFLHLSGRVGNYVIVDLPEMLLHSSHTIVKYVPGANITHNDLSGFDPAAPGPNFYFLTPPRLNDVPDRVFDLCLNFNSFMEMDGDVRDHYIAEVYRVGRRKAIFFNVNRRQRALPQRDGSTYDNNPLLYPYRRNDKVLAWEEDKFQQATRSWFLKVPSLAITRVASINPKGD